MAQMMPFFLVQLTEGLNYYDFDLFFGKLQASWERTASPEQVSREKNIIFKM